MAKQPKYLSLNGKVVPYEDARIHILSPAAKYGAGVFEGIRGYWNDDQEEMYIFRLKEHLDRLQFSMKVQRIADCPSSELLTEKLIEVLHANKFRETVHIRMTVYVDGDGDQGALGPMGYAIAALPRPLPEAVRKGVTAQISSWTRIADNSVPARVKCNANYINGRLASMQAKADGYDASIILNSRGKVAEGPGMCFFMVRDGVPVTPSATNDILESVTRTTLIEIFEEYMGLKTVERDVDRTELYDAEEAFYCGTGWEITPILSVDRLPVGKGAVGPVTRKLQEHYFNIVLGKVKDHAAWRHPVFGKAKRARAAE
ncbi:MAG: branched-chain amino acid transaminase [Proteobacteria bacterium]|nr:branched-chain amino acid transaminase [Pseudomonadota bacterium]